MNILIFTILISLVFTAAPVSFSCLAKCTEQADENCGTVTIDKTMLAGGNIKCLCTKQSGYSTSTSSWSNSKWVFDSEDNCHAKSDESGESGDFILIGCIIAVVAVLIGAGVFLFFYLKRRRQNTQQSPGNLL